MNNVLELIVRAKSVDGVTVEGYFVPKFEANESLIMTPYVYSDGEYIPIIFETLKRCTGIFDEKLNPIFEGDFLVVYFEDSVAEGTVIWDKHSASWCLNNPKNEYLEEIIGENRVLFKRG